MVLKSYAMVFTGRMLNLLQCESEGWGKRTSYYSTYNPATLCDINRSYRSVSSVWTFV